MSQILQFAFIVLVPLALVAGGLVSLLAIGALFDASEHPGELKGRIDGLFRQPARPPKPTDKKHYYKPYWETR
jgi:hypothetical protein